MYILTERTPGQGNLYLYPIDEMQGFHLFTNSNIIKFNSAAVSAAYRPPTGTTPEQLKARFDDIIRALQSGKVNVYDTRKPIGTQPKPKSGSGTTPAPVPKQGADS